jgi:hypothetical protein
VSKQSLQNFIGKLHQELTESPAYREHTANLRTHHFIFDKKDFEKRIAEDLEARGLILTTADKQKLTEQSNILGASLVTEIRQIRKERVSAADMYKESQGSIDYAFTSKTQTTQKSYGPAEDVYEKLKSVYRASVKDFFINMQAYFSTMMESKEETDLRVANRKGKTKGKTAKRGIRHKGKGNLVKVAGRFVNAEHEDDAGIAETLIRDAFKKSASEVVDTQGNSISEAQLIKDLANLGIELIMRKDANDNHVITLGGSLINSQKGQDSKKMKADLQKELERAFYHLEKGGLGIAHLAGSDTPTQKRKKRVLKSVLDPFKKNTNTKVKHGDLTTKSSAAKVGITKKRKVSKKTSNVTLATGALALKKSAKKRRKPTQKSPLQDMLKLVVQFNSRLPQTVRKNMGSPSLNNRTGRFANSAQVSNVIMTPQGFPSVGYTYQKEPYQVFEEGVGLEPWANGQRDPRDLINRSIREIAAELAMGRIYTRRV